jgi:hypothetical protein
MKPQLLVLTVLSMMTLLPTNQAKSQDRPICYVQQASGQTVDLSKICVKKSPSHGSQSKVDSANAGPKSMPSYETTSTDSDQSLVKSGTAGNASISYPPH